VCHITCSFDIAITVNDRYILKKIKSFGVFLDEKHNTVEYLFHELTVSYCQPTLSPVIEDEA